MFGIYIYIRIYNQLLWYILNQLNEYIAFTVVLSTVLYRLQGPGAISVDGFRLLNRERSVKVKEWVFIATFEVCKNNFSISWQGGNVHSQSSKNISIVKLPLHDKVLCCPKVPHQHVSSTISESICIYGYTETDSVNSLAPRNGCETGCPELSHAKCLSCNRRSDQ